MIPFPKKQYVVIYADPPWSYTYNKERKKKLIGRIGSLLPKYNTITLNDIKTLPVSQISANNSVLLIWATSPLLPEALQVISAWGFKFKTVAFCWYKLTTRGKEVANLGQWTMANMELCLLATKGSPKRLSRNVRQNVVTNRGKHSQKPEEVRYRIETLFGDVPRIELFARRKAEGWDSWGNESNKVSGFFY